MQESDEKMKNVFEVINYHKEQQPYYTNARLGYIIYFVCVCTLNSADESCSEVIFSLRLKKEFPT